METILQHIKKNRKAFVLQKELKTEQKQDSKKFTKSEEDLIINTFKALESYTKGGLKINNSRDFLDSLNENFDMQDVSEILEGLKEVYPCIKAHQQDEIDLPDARDFFNSLTLR